MALLSPQASGTLAGASPRQVAVPQHRPRAIVPRASGASGMAADVAVDDLVQQQMEETARRCVGVAIVGGDVAGVRGPALTDAASLTQACRSEGRDGSHAPEAAAGGGRSLVRLVARKNARSGRRRLCLSAAYDAFLPEQHAIASLCRAHVQAAPRTRPRRQLRARARQQTGNSRRRMWPTAAPRSPATAPAIESSPARLSLIHISQGIVR